MENPKPDSWVIHAKLFLFFSFLLGAGDSMWLSLDSLACKDMVLENIPSKPAG